MFDSNIMGEALLQPNVDVSIETLQASSSDQEFTGIFEQLLDRQVDRLNFRVGLVPNYFMTRGEAAGATLNYKVAEKFFKLFHQRDFREEQAYAEFEEILRCASTTQQQDRAFNVLNRRYYKGGDSLLHVLVRRRHLRFLRTLLLCMSTSLDLDQRNNLGYSALDLAVDRLEVEAVYLLLLHGASDTRTVPRTSLGYGEWLRYDMFLNLDTGRWLHQQSEAAIMEHFSASFSPETRKALLEWTSGGIMGNDTLQRLGRMPCLFTIVLADGCDAITNHEAWATIVRHMSFLRDKIQDDKSNEKSTDRTNTNFPEATQCSDLYAFLEEQGADTSHFRTAGRTIFFSCHDGNEIAVKVE